MVSTSDDRQSGSFQPLCSDRVNLLVDNNDHLELTSEAERQYILWTMGPEYHVLLDWFIELRQQHLLQVEWELAPIEAKIRYV